MIMSNNFIKPLGLTLSLLVAGLFPACQKEDSAADTENFVLQSMYEIEERCGSGMEGCYELVFPVTLQFVDNTTVEVSDYDALRQAIRDWYQANAGDYHRPNRPRLVLPFDVLNDAGEVITVSTQEELMALRQACIVDTFGPNHHDHLGKDRPCFRPVFPLTLSFPDGTQGTYNTPLELQQAIRAWKSAHPDSQQRPEIVFPITVQKKDGTQVVVNSPEELRALKADCRG
jgi:hypothetical protein